MREINLLPNLESENRQKIIWADLICIAIFCLAVSIIFLVKSITVHKIEELRLDKNKLIEKQSRFLSPVSDMKLLTHKYTQLRDTIGTVEHNRDQIITIVNLLKEFDFFESTDSSIRGFKYEGDDISFFVSERHEKEFSDIMDRVCRKYNLDCQNIVKINKKHYSIFGVHLR